MVTRLLTLQVTTYLLSKENNLLCILCCLGYFAKKIRAKKLIMTHFSPRYKGDDSEFSMSIMWRIEDMAREASGLNGRNDVIAAWDLMTLAVRSPIKKEAVDAASSNTASMQQANN